MDVVANKALHVEFSRAGHVYVTWNHITKDTVLMSQVEIS